MEKQAKMSAKMKFLRFLPKATAMTFQNLQFSPKTKAHSGKLILPGPIIPPEARLRRKKTLAQEPTSPKISCMGQIKHKKRVVAKQEKVKREKDTCASMPKVSKYPETMPKEDPIKGRHVFSGEDKPTGRKSDVGMSDRVPSLSQMKCFASGRDSIPKFDWTSQISPLDGNEKEVINSFSGPNVVNGVVLEPKKEINLWKRRTFSRPKSLKI